MQSLRARESDLPAPEPPRKGIRASGGRWPESFSENSAYASNVQNQAPEWALIAVRGMS
jgi:hypothetical protein